MSELKNINLEVSKFAMKCVENAIYDNDIENSKYKTIAKKMATLIQKNGLIGTLVFNLSKAEKNHHKQILFNIIEWNLENDKINYIKDITKKVESKDEGIDIKNQKCFTDYISWVSELDPKEYRLITKEMINLFGWIKRFADGLIEDDSDGE